MACQILMKMSLATVSDEFARLNLSHNIPLVRISVSVCSASFISTTYVSLLGVLDQPRSRTI